MKLGIDVITDVEEVDKQILQDLSTCNSIFSFCQSKMGSWSADSWFWSA